MPCKLAVTLPELVKGKVHAAVVDKVPGDGLGVSLGNTICQQTFTQDYHDAFPVTARHLRRQDRKNESGCKMSYNRKFASLVLFTNVM